MEDTQSLLKKAYVLDTNVLIHDPNSLLNFEEHRVIIPMTVLEELDKLKSPPFVLLTPSSVKRSPRRSVRACPSGEKLPAHISARCRC